MSAIQTYTKEQFSAYIKAHPIGGVTKTDEQIDGYWSALSNQKCIICAGASPTLVGLYATEGDGYMFYRACNTHTAEDVSSKLGTKLAEMKSR